MVVLGAVGHVDQGRRGQSDAGQSGERPRDGHGKGGGRRKACTDRDGAGNRQTRSGWRRVSSFQLPHDADDEPAPASGNGPIPAETLHHAIAR